MVLFIFGGFVMAGNARGILHAIKFRRPKLRSQMINLEANEESSNLIRGKVCLSAAIVTWEVFGLFVQCRMVAQCQSEYPEGNIQENYMHYPAR